MRCPAVRVLVLWGRLYIVSIPDPHKNPKKTCGKPRPGAVRESGNKKPRGLGPQGPVSIGVQRAQSFWGVRNVTSPLTVWKTAPWPIGTAGVLTAPESFVLAMKRPVSRSITEMTPS